MSALDMPMQASPLSGVPAAILLGMAINNVAGTHASLKPGLDFCKTTLLRAGIICIGAKISFVDVFGIGASGIPAVVAAIASGAVVAPYLSRKLGLSSRFGALMAAGTSICGVTAISALAPVIKASEKDTSFAIANVVAFGTINMLLMPHVAHMLLPTSEQAGLFLGLAVHDTAQVVGAALSYNELYSDEIAMQAAIVTKLTRNIFLAAAIPGLAYMQLRRDAMLMQNTETNSDTDRKEDSNPRVQTDAITIPAFSKVFPTFVFGFLGFAALRTGGDVLLLSSEHYATWKATTSFIGTDMGGHYLLGTAMASIGLTTNLSALTSVGVRPFIVGFGTAAAVAGTGMGCALLLF